MKIEIEIPNKDIIDVFITALEGGSNYWYDIPDLSGIEKISKEFAVSERIPMAVLEHDVIIPVYDIEDPTEKLGDISKRNIKRGLKLYLMNKNVFDAGEMDAGDADVFFQYVVMGKLVFG